MRLLDVLRLRLLAYHHDGPRRPRAWPSTTELDVLDYLTRMAPVERAGTVAAKEDIAVVYAALDGWLARQQGDRTSN